MTDDDLGREQGGNPGGTNGKRGHEDIGSVAEEAAKLFGALSGWAKEHSDDLGHGVSGMASGAGGAMRDVNEHLATDSAECRVCPVCRAIHVVRELSPEVKTHLAVASANLMQAAAAWMATAAPEESKPQNGRGSDFEKINLDEDWPEE